jgi:diguanylate cyclase (GGDEF)-like protein
MPAAALLIDLDRFKRLNDIYGPREGDKLLHAAAQRIQAAARRIADQFRHPEARPPLLARFSGDEYALLLCGPSPTTAARAAAQAILENLREPFPLNEGEAVLTASIGVARAPVDGREIEELLRLANLALDGVKAEGGDGCRFFEMEMTRRAVQRMTLENELRRAIANREFVVHYQPKVDARSGEITGCEALVRWRRGDKIVGPAGFIPAAEDCGLINEVGEFVLGEACAAASRWRARGAVCTVAVNVSAIQFQSPDFSRRVLDVLQSSGLPPHLLELELTESVAMRDPDEVIKQVQPMREKGVRFAIDDFGTGHSSLATLTRLPFDTFKIDQTFVRQMETDPSARVVVETILAMARALGYDTVGEGVETPTQFAFLRLNGCTTAQGWYFGKPAPESEFFARLTSDRRPPEFEAAV